MDKPYKCEKCGRGYKQNGVPYHKHINTCNYDPKKKKVKKVRKSKGTMYTKLNKEKVIKAINKKPHTITSLAIHFHIAWQTMKNYIQKNKDVYDAFINSSEMVDDAAENNIFNDIFNEKNVNTSKWYLSCVSDKYKKNLIVEAELSGELKLNIISNNKNLDKL